MKFTYTYRSSDGQRHSAEIEAESRDAAFAVIRRELGIKPIKVTAADGSKGNGEKSGKGASHGRAALVAAGVLFAAVLGGVAWWMRSTSHESQAANNESPTPTQAQPITVATPQGPVTLRVAEPLPRQMIPGDRRRIEGAMNGQDVRSPSEAKSQSTSGVFKFAAEKWLARFAEPGRISFIAINEMNGGQPPARPSEAEFAECLKEPIRIASFDFTEVVDLKRIVTGMKREMNAYLAGGGTVDGYLAELEKRQKLEVSYRERAEQKLNDMLNGQDARSPSATGGTPVVPASGQDARGRDSLKAAYAYWLKANAQLQAMGIYPLALPDALRSYQMSLDIDE